MAKCHGLRVSYDPPGCGSDGCAFLRCRGHALTMARRAGGCQLPGRFPRRTVPAATSFFLYDRQVSSQRQDCRFCGWQLPQGFHAKRHGKWDAHHVQSDFSCLCSQQIFFSSALVRAQMHSSFDNVREQRWTRSAPHLSLFRLTYSALNLLRPEYAFSIPSRAGSA